MSELSKGELYQLRQDLDVPEWVDVEYVTCAGKLDRDVIAPIVEGGCMSGAYMPACWYSVARETMAEHGDDVLSYLWEHYGEVPEAPKDDTCPSWSNLCCFYLQCAVECWAAGALDQIDEEDEEEEED